MTSEANDDNVSTDYVATILRETDNGPRLELEQEILREVFGEPNANGVYFRDEPEVFNR